MEVTVISITKTPMYGSKDFTTRETATLSDGREITRTVWGKPHEDQSWAGCFKGDDIPGDVIPELRGSLHKGQVVRVDN